MLYCDSLVAGGGTLCLLLDDLAGVGTTSPHTAYVLLHPLTQRVLKHVHSGLYKLIQGQLPNKFIFII